MAHKATIARSGIQYYLDEELPGLGLSNVPREYRGQRVFAVYRPSFVLEAAKDKFVGAPVRVGHKWVYDDSDPEIIGKVMGDVAVKHLKNEVALCSSLDVDDSRLPRKRELSPGYKATNRWCAGVSPDGSPYDILCTAIDEINHVAVVDEARGGEDMKILDGGRRLMVHSGLIHGIKKRLKGILDGKCEDTFEKDVDKMSEVLDNGGGVTDEMVSALSGRCSTLPDSEEKDKLLRYISDIPLLAQEDGDVRKEALNCIKESYRMLDSDAVSDATEKPMEEKKDEGKEPVEKTTDALPQQDGAEPCPPAEPCPGTPAEKGAEEHTTVVSAINEVSAKLDRLLSALEGKVSDAAKEEKKDEPADEGANDACPDGDKEKDDGKGVGDSAPALPPYTQSLGAVNTGYSLDDAFAKLKGRK